MYKQLADRSNYIFPSNFFQPRMALSDIKIINEIASQVWNACKDVLADVNALVKKDQECIDFWGKSGLGKQDIIGKKDEDTNRIPLGFLADDSNRPSVKETKYASEYQVTLFGSPANSEQAFKAMLAATYKEKGYSEHSFVTDLVNKFLKENKSYWGADLEDSATTDNEVLGSSLTHLQGCYNGAILDKEGKSLDVRLHDEQSFKSVPIIRVPGINIKDADSLNKPQLKESSMPLNVIILAQHMWENRNSPERLQYYVPKLRTEDDASYLNKIIDDIEDELIKKDSSFIKGNVKLFIVVEDIRAIFRVEEIVKNFNGKVKAYSLGWHDYVASGAEVLREFGGKNLKKDAQDQAYSIPTKMLQQEIVTRYIPKSQQLLGHVAHRIGGVPIGGMYGVLFNRPHMHSEQYSLQTAGREAAFKGLFKEVMTQYSNGVRGFWLATPVYSRISMALVQVLKDVDSSNSDKGLHELIDLIFQSDVNKTDLKQLWQRLKDENQEILNQRIAYDKNPKSFYENNQRVLELIAAGLSPKDTISDTDIEKGYSKNASEKAVRYNIFQASQYLASWLGHKEGAVALPATIDTQEGSADIRVMDDLATTRRSIEEVFQEIYNDRLSKQDFVKYLNKEFTRLENNEDPKILIKWQKSTQKWYPVVKQLLMKCMTSANRDEVLPDLLIRFLSKSVMDSDNPWKILESQFPEIYSIPEDVKCLNEGFERINNIKL